MDASKIPELGKENYVHVFTDILSIMTWATAQPEESDIHILLAILHYQACFSFISIPDIIKYTNGLAYVFHKIQNFYNIFMLQIKLRYHIPLQDKQL